MQNIQKYIDTHPVKTARRNKKIAFRGQKVIVFDIDSPSYVNVSGVRFHPSMFTRSSPLLSFQCRFNEVRLYNATFKYIECNDLDTIVDDMVYPKIRYSGGMLGHVYT